VTTCSLLAELQSARWFVAGRTIGNDHATLIGLLVDWWVSLAPRDHWVLEGGPGNGYSRRGARGQCDALLCSGAQAFGVLEVEGSRYDYTVKKVGSFFAARIPDYRSLRFAVLVLYTYEPVGRGGGRRLPPAVTPDTLRVVRQVSAAYPDHELALVSVDKRYVRHAEGLRSRNEYYFGEPARIVGHLFKRGEQIETAVFYDSDAASLTSSRT
jgi:hypothetical protein